MRRIVKVPSNASLSDNLIIDYVNRFYLMDVDARVQLFDFKTKYQFETIPGVVDYNLPLYSLQTQPGNQQISPYPVYQGVMAPCYVDGLQAPVYTQKESFSNVYPTYLQELPNAATGDGVTTTFTLNLPYFPSIPGHLDMSGIIASGNTLDPIFTTAIPTNPVITGTPIIPYSSIYPGVFITYTNQSGGIVTVTDSGLFLSGNTGGQLYGLLMLSQSSGSINPNPFGYTPLSGNTNYTTTSNTVNYSTGVVNVTFPSAPLAGAPIQAQCYFYEQGIPRAILFQNNCISIRPPCNTTYLVELQAYLTPAAFLSSSASLPFGYMAEYIARGAARKILSDVGDVDQFMFYEPLFKEQETLVWKRSQRVFTSTRTQTIFSDQAGFQAPYSNMGQGAT